MVLRFRWIFSLSFLGVAAVAACVSDAPSTDQGTDGGDQNGDATTGGGDSSTSDAGADAPTGPCNLDAAFSAPTIITSLPNPINSVVRLSQDEHTAYFAMAAFADGGGPFHIYQASRTDMGDDFGTPVALDALNDDAGESDPAISIDGLDIIYVHTYGWNNNDGTPRDIWDLHRGSLDAGFVGTPGPIPGVLNVTGVQDDYPSLTTGDDMWFVSVRGDAGQAIYNAASAGGVSYNAANIAANINASGTKQYYPVVTNDRKRIYYTRNADVYTATRTSETDDFTNPVAVSELNPTDQAFRPGWVSPDGCRLYLTSGSPQTAYVAAKPPN